MAGGVDTMKTWIALLLGFRPKVMVIRKDEMASAIANSPFFRGHPQS